MSISNHVNFIIFIHKLAENRYLEQWLLHGWGTTGGLAPAPWTCGLFNVAVLIVFIEYFIYGMIRNVIFAPTRRSVITVVDSGPLYNGTRDLPMVMVAGLTIRDRSADDESIDFFSILYPSYPIATCQDTLPWYAANESVGTRLTGTWEETADEQSLRVEWPTSCFPITDEYRLEIGKKKKETYAEFRRFREHIIIRVFT